MRSKQKYIYVCPNGCDAALVCDFEVTETWVVNAYGEPMELESSDEPGLTTNTPRCSKCHANAEEHKCEMLPVWTATNECLGTAYFPSDLNEVLFFERLMDRSRVGSGNMIRLAIGVGKKEGESAIIIDGTIYLQEDDGFRPRLELPGQVSLFEGETHERN